jgi:hypothetical protein
MACWGHGSRRDVPAPLMTSGAWLRAHAITPVVVGDNVGPPRGPAFLPEARCASKDRARRGSPLGSGETEPAPKGSDESEPVPLGPGDIEPTPLGAGESEPFSEGSDEVVVIPLII